MASAGPRVQLALGRVQLQEQRVSNLLRRVEEVRHRLVAAQGNYDHQQQRLERLEASLRHPQPEGVLLGALQEALPMSKRDASQAAADLQRITAEETAVAADLALEQARWTELSQRMEALEDALGRR
jgi:hypothetical protein